MVYEPRVGRQTNAHYQNRSYLANACLPPAAPAILIPKRIRHRLVAILTKGHDRQTGGAPVDPPVAVRGAEYGDIRPAVAVIVARDRNVRRGAEMMDRVGGAAAVGNKPLPRRRPVHGNIGFAVAVIV